MEDAQPINSPPVLWPDPKNGPWQITLTWLKLGGRFECVGVSVKSHASDFWDMDLEAAQASGEAAITPVTSTLWREIPISSIIDADREKTVEWIGDGRGPGFTPQEWSGKGRRPRHSLAEVAQIYTTAWQRGDPPTKAVAEALVISQSAAAKQVARARSRGFLAPTTKGKAGAS